MSYGFSFNGIHSSQYGLHLQTESLPAISNKRLITENVPQRDGHYEFENGYENKLIELQCTLIERNFVLRRQKIRDIIHWLSSKGKLVLDYESDKYYTARISGEIKTEIGRAMDILSIKFLAEPFAKSESVIIERTGITTDTSIILVNQGTYESKPVFEIDGTATGVTISAPRGSFYIANITKKVYIDCDKMICYTLDALGAKENKLTDFQGEFFSLDVGTQTIDITGTALNINIKIDMQHTYL